MRSTVRTFLTLQVSCQAPTVASYSLFAAPAVLRLQLHSAAMRIQSRRAGTPNYFVILRHLSLDMTLLLFLLLPPAAFAQEPPPAKVAVQQIVREIVSENRSYIGLLTYDRKSQVSSDVSGLVERVLVTEGDRVQAGEPLIRLDTEILEQEISLRKTRIEQIDLRIQLARKNYTRLETLLNRKGTSEKNYDDAVYDYQDSLAEKKSSELELEKLLIQKRKSVINAPFDGIILAKNVETGEWVQQGKQLVSIGSTQDLIVKVPVEETILQFITIGEEVPVNINAFNKKLTGTISQVIPTADVRTKNVF